MVQWKVFHDGVEVDNIVSIRVDTKANAESSTAEILISNVDASFVEAGELLIPRGSNFTLYASETIVDTSNVLHRIGTFTFINESLTPDNRMITLTLVNKTFQMLSRVWLGEETDTVDVLVNGIVQRINQDGTVQNNVGVQIPSTRSDGSPFPERTIVSATKTAYDLLLDLSSTGYTGDRRPYIFYFDEDEVFHWVYPDDTIEDYFDYNTSLLIETKVDKNDSEVVNMVIFDGGEDKNGASILDFYLKPDSGSIEGRMIFQPMRKISEGLKAKYISEGTYAGMSNETFISNVVEQCKGRAESIAYAWNEGLWKATLTFQGRRFDLAKKYELSLPLHGMGSESLRVDNIVHTYDKNGWVTKITMMQDPEELDEVTN
jgi:hypothetical protein